MYTVKSKKSLKGMFDIFQEQKIKVKLLSENQIEIFLQNEIEKDIFIRILSLYIVFISFKDIVVKSLMSLGFSKEKAEKKTSVARNGLEETNYFTSLTSLLLLEYFKTMQTINVDSFILFNMKGYKQELKELAEFIKNSTSHINKHEKQLSAEELFDIIKQHAIENNMNYNDFSEIHISCNQKKLIFENKQGVLIDNDFLNTKLGCSLVFYQEDMPLISKIYKNIFFLKYIALIFDVKKVVLHKSLSQNDIKELSAINLIIKNKIEFIKCCGCDKCNPEN